MPSDRLASKGGSAKVESRKLFTPESANGALVLVRRIVTDISREYRGLMELRRQRESLSFGPTKPEQLTALRELAEKAVEKLTAYQEELAEVGCSLKDYAAGLVDFPAMHEGRVVYLCWKLGEERIAHWHEVDSGYRGRHAVDAEFGDTR
ncbi:MAG: DUF2203 domain-containing protein [Phycisphaerae bacterium]